MMKGFPAPDRYRDGAASPQDVSSATPSAPFPTSLGIDLFLASMLASHWSFNVFMFPDFRTFSIYAPLLFAAAIFVALSLWPLLRSVPIPPSELPLRIKRTSIRRSTRPTMQTIDLIFRRFILVPSQGKSEDLAQYASQFHHEAGHIHAGDARFFTFIYPFLIANVALSIFLLANFDAFYWTKFDFVVWEGPSSSYGLALFVSLIIILPSLLLLGLFVLTIRDREFLADRYAYGQLGRPYADFLERMARRERYTRARSPLIRYWNAILHPTFQSRLHSLSHLHGTLSLPTFASGFLFNLLAPLSFAVVFFQWSVYYTSHNTDILDGQNLNSTHVIWTIAVFFIVFLSLLAYVSNCFSIAARTCSARLYLKHTVSFCCGAVLSNVIRFYILVTVFAKQPETTSSIDSSFDYGAFPFTLLRFPVLPIIIIGLFWFFMSSLIPRLGYNFLFNAIVGSIAISMAFLTSPGFQATVYNIISGRVTLF